MNDVRKVGVVEGLLRSSSSSSNRGTLIWIPSERLVRSYNAKLNLTLFSFANPMIDTKTKTREAPKIKSGCSNGILPNSVSTPPQAHGRFVGTIFGENQHIS